MDKVIDAEFMKKRILKVCYRGFDFATDEIAPYHTDIRFDVMGLQRFNRNVKIFEVKSCRQDFISDKKWDKYLPFATHFYFAAPKGVIQPSELPNGIGLVEFWKMPHGYIAFDYTKKCRKQPPITQENYIKLIEAAFMRLKWKNECLQGEIKFYKDKYEPEEEKWN